MTAATVSTAKAFVRPPAQAPATWAMGSLFEMLATTADTGAPLDVALVTQPPGVATPLHVHTRESEAFYVLDGTLTYQAGDDLHHLAAGWFIHLPLGVPHAFRITGDTPARILALTLPGGLMDLYTHVGIPATERRLPGPDGQPMPTEIARWNDLGPRYGLRVIGPPLPAQPASTDAPGA
jgi:quercetin dioxygenase-like cupin family protein